MLKDIFEDLKKASHIERFNFIASIVSVLGISLLTIITYVKNFFVGRSLFAISVHSFLTGCLVLVLGIILLFGYYVISQLKKEKIFILLIALCVTVLMVISLIFMSVSLYIELMNIPVIG